MNYKDSLLCVFVGLGVGLCCWEAIGIVNCVVR
jgi:hypothetical protein